MEDPESFSFKSQKPLSFDIFGKAKNHHGVILAYFFEAETLKCENVSALEWVALFPPVNQCEDMHIQLEIKPDRMLRAVGVFGTNCSEDARQKVRPVDTPSSRRNFWDRTVFQDPPCWFPLLVSTLRKQISDVIALYVLFLASVPWVPKRTKHVQCSHQIPMKLCQTQHENKNIIQSQKQRWGLSVRGSASGYHSRAPADTNSRETSSKCRDIVLLPNRESILWIENSNASAKTHAKCPIKLNAHATERVGKSNFVRRASCCYGKPKPRKPNSTAQANMISSLRNNFVHDNWVNGDNFVKFVGHCAGLMRS